MKHRFQQHTNSPMEWSTAAAPFFFREDKLALAALTRREIIYPGISSVLLIRVYYKVHLPGNIFWGHGCGRGP